MNLTVQNATIFMKETGEGPPTLFLHGNPDSSIMWRGVIEEMKTRFRCLAPDLPGFGHSSIPPGFDFSLESFAAFINDLLDAAGITEPVNLVMHDFGGPYGLSFAVRHPERVSRMAIMNTNFFSDYQWHIWGRIWRTRFLGELSLMSMTWGMFRTSMRKGAPTISEEHLRDTYALYKWPVKKMVLKLYRSTNPENYKGWEEKLPELTRRLPTCVLWGDRDPYIDSTFAGRFGAQKVWHFAQNGHFLPVEAPKEVAEKIMSFFP
jgi:pimeloyl-ACP methyl ester carboxylesterase